MTTVTDNFPSEYFPPTPRGITSLTEAHDYLTARREQLATTVGNLLTMANNAIEREDVAGARLMLGEAASYIAEQGRMNRRTA